MNAPAFSLSPFSCLPDASPWQAVRRLFDSSITSSESPTIVSPPTAFTSVPLRYRSVNPEHEATGDQGVDRSQQGLVGSEHA